MNNNEIDKLIEDSIALNLNSLTLRDEVFAKIKDNIDNQKKRSNYKALKTCISRRNPLKVAAGFMSALIIFCSLSLLISPNARVFATNAMNAIKTIFTVDDNGQVVEVGQDEPVLNNGYGMVPGLSDSDIEKKVGFKIVIPNSLSDGFSLSDKGIGLFLGKDISYEANERISPICQKAILDDTALERLKEYNPSRYAGGVYKNKEGEIALAVVKLTDRYYKAIEILKKSKYNYKEIKIGNIKGIWIEEIRGRYPTDTKGSADMTQKPTALIHTYDIAWVSNNLMYFMSTANGMDTNNGYKLSPEMGKRIAESFMASQK